MKWKFHQLHQHVMLMNLIQILIYHSTTSTNPKKRDDIVTIGVHDLVLNENCSVFDDENCEKVFVGVEFLDYPAEQLETPYALVKGEPNTKYSFNFQTGLMNFIIYFYKRRNHFLKIVLYMINRRNNNLLNLLAHDHLESMSSNIKMIISYYFI